MKRTVWNNKQTSYTRRFIKGHVNFQIRLQSKDGSKPNRAKIKADLLEILVFQKLKK